MGFRWRSEHLLAWALCLGAVLCPRGIWDRGRLTLTGWLDRSMDAGGCPEAVEERKLIRAALMTAEARAAEYERTLAETTALKQALPAVRLEAVLPVHVSGAESAALDAGAGRARLDSGTDSGVAVHAPLVLGGALVGRVVAVSSGASEVELATAPTFRARARIVRTGLEGMVRGAGPGALVFRPEHAGAPLERGDAVVTSGESTYAPGDLAIGTVTSIDVDPRTGISEARLEPLLDLARLDRALLIVGPPEVAPGAAPVAVRGIGASKLEVSR